MGDLDDLSMKIRVLNDFRISGSSNLLLVEAYGATSRLVWFVDYWRWRDEGGPAAGECASLESSWLVEVISFEATEEAFDRLVRTCIFADYFRVAWEERIKWAAKAGPWSHGLERQALAQVRARGEDVELTPAQQRCDCDTETETVGQIDPAIAPRSIIRQPTCPLCHTLPCRCGIMLELDGRRCVACGKPKQ